MLSIIESIAASECCLSGHCIVLECRSSAVYVDRMRKFARKVSGRVVSAGSGCGQRFCGVGRCQASYHTYLINLFCVSSMLSTKVKPSINISIINFYRPMIPILISPFLSERQLMFWNYFSTDFQRRTSVREFQLSSGQIQEEYQLQEEDTGQLQDR